MAIRLATPGVYIEEKNAFPSSVAAAPTAVPAFVGYTQKIVRAGQSLVNKPVRITSLPEFEQIFGFGFRPTFNVGETKDIETDFVLGSKAYKVMADKKSRFVLYESLRLFFSNGGSACYIVSVGSYYKQDDSPTPPPPPPGPDGKKTPPSPSKSGEPKMNAIKKKELEDGINTLISEDEPTMLVVPEAVMLEKADCFALQQHMLMHCGYKMKDRFAIFDVYDGFLARTYDDTDVITQFREGVGSNFLNYGAAYYPWVYTSVVQNTEINYKNISNLDKLADILTEEIKETTEEGNKKRQDEIKAEIAKLKDPKVNPESLTETLNTISPIFKIIIDRIKRHMNIIPPSAGLAGVYTTVDNTSGVWKSPANVGFNNVISPVVKMTDDDQEDLNINVTGKSVNGIRTFVGEGTKVWGARTLEGNSQDWRYINVRRTLLFIETSVKGAARTYVFANNTNNTWTLVKSMITSFLNDLWKQGGLAGLTPEHAYEVQVGLGTTMSPNDILDGVMRVSVKVAITRPAEFIVITFQQKMQES